MIAPNVSYGPDGPDGKGTSRLVSDFRQQLPVGQPTAIMTAFATVATSRPMSRDIVRSVPYEPQHGPRWCGAACLSMAYRALGRPEEQFTIWGRVAAPNRFGVTCTLTHRLAADAIERGLAAVVLQASHPPQLLAACLAAGIVVVANHRFDARSAGGHFSIVTAADSLGVTLHDPQAGPDHRLTTAEWVKLWDSSRAADVAGRVMIALGPADDAPAVCPDCGDPLPPTAPCGQCRRDVSLRPAVAVGCLKARCAARRWGKLFCPHCDYGRWD